MKKLIRWFRKNNEFTFVVALVLVIWYLAPVLLRLIDPQSGEFGVEVLYIPLIAGVYFLMGMLFVWVYLRLVFPVGFDLLDKLFEVNGEITKWEKLQVILRLFQCLVILYAVCLLAVTGISYIM